MSAYFEESDVVSTYSRVQAIEDGVLVDVSATARQAGVRFPCALSAGAWATCVAWSEADSDAQGIPQDEQGRLWDVLTMFALAARKADGPELQFGVLCIPCDGKSQRARLTQLWASIGPGDDPAPVITIMLPGED